MTFSSAVKMRKVSPGGVYHPWSQTQKILELASGLRQEVGLDSFSYPGHRKPPNPGSQPAVLTMSALSLSSLYTPGTKAQLDLPSGPF